MTRILSWEKVNNAIDMYDETMRSARIKYNSQNYSLSATKEFVATMTKARETLALALVNMPQNGL
jgi:hypothetical protein